jgi:hypothetical protein
MEQLCLINAAKKRYGKVGNPEYEQDCSHHRFAGPEMYKMWKQKIRRQNRNILQHAVKGPPGRHDQEGCNAINGSLKNK